MDIKTIRELTRLMRDNDLVEIEAESSDLKIKLKKSGGVVTHVAHPAPLVHAAAPAAPAAPAVPVDEFAGCRQVISPIPGTVYLKPNPDAANFVQLGTPVDDTKVVCLIEAMKVFNEIKPDAPVRGSIKKICVADGQAVEYGTILFLVG